MESSYLNSLDVSDLESKFGTRFETYGYPYVSMVANMGTGFLWLVICLAYQVLFLMFYYCLKYCNK